MLALPLAVLAALLALARGADECTLGNSGTACATCSTTAPTQCGSCNEDHALKNDGACAEIGTDCPFYELVGEVKHCRTTCDAAEGGTAGADNLCTYACPDPDTRGAGCKVCDDDDEEGTFVCTGCKTGSYLVTGDGWPSQNARDVTVGTCVSENDCKTAGGKVDGANCVARSCVPNEGNCGICDQATDKCKKCTGDFGLKDGACVAFGTAGSCTVHWENADGAMECGTSCSGGATADASTGLCPKTCTPTDSAKCAECTADPDVCTRCKPTYGLKAGACLAFGDSGCEKHWADEDNNNVMTCGANCPNGKSDPDNDGLCTSGGPGPGPITSDCADIRDYPSDACAGPVFAPNCYGFIGCDACGLDAQHNAYCLHCAYGEAKADGKGCQLSTTECNVPGCSGCKSDDLFTCDTDKCESGLALTTDGRCEPSSKDAKCAIYDGADCVFCEDEWFLGADGCEQPDGRAENCKFFDKEDATKCVVCKAGHRLDTATSTCEKITDNTCKIGTTDCQQCSSGGTCMLCPAGQGFGGQSVCEECLHAKTCAKSTDEQAAAADCKEKHGVEVYTSTWITQCYPLPDMCPSGEKSTADGCVACTIANCVACATINNVEHCGECADGFALNDAGACVAAPSNCDAPADADGNCPVGSCKDGYYEAPVTDKAGVTCTPCPVANSRCPRGGECTTADHCSDCVSGYYMSNNQCAPCATGCGSCTATECRGCAAGYGQTITFDKKTLGITASGECQALSDNCAYKSYWYKMNTYGILTGIEEFCAQCMDGSATFVETSEGSGIYTSECTVSKHNPLGPGAIAGIAIAAVVVVAAIVLGCVFGIKACKNKKAKQQGGNEQALQPISS